MKAKRRLGLLSGLLSDEEDTGGNEGEVETKRERQTERARERGRGNTTRVCGVPNSAHGNETEKGGDGHAPFSGWKNQSFPHWISFSKRCVCVNVPSCYRSSLRRCNRAVHCKKGPPQSLTRRSNPQSMSDRSSPCSPLSFLEPWPGVKNPPDFVAWHHPIPALLGKKIVKKNKQKNSF